MQSRYYNPKVGRFLNADALASTGQGALGNNMFAYSNSNPTNKADYTGESAVAYKGDLAGYGGGGVVGTGSLEVLIGVVYLIVEGVNRLIDYAKTSAATRAEKKYKFEYEEHHIVAQSSPKAAPARAILNQVFPNEGTNIAINKVVVSTTLHKGLHTNYYYGLVNYIIITAYCSANGNPAQEVTNVSNALFLLNAAIAVADKLWRG